MSYGSCWYSRPSDTFQSRRNKQLRLGIRGFSRWRQWDEVLEDFHFCGCIHEPTVLFHSSWTKAVTHFFKSIITSFLHFVTILVFHITVSQWLQSDPSFHPFTIIQLFNSSFLPSGFHFSSTIYYSSSIFDLVTPISTAFGAWHIIVDERFLIIHVRPVLRKNNNSAGPLHGYQTE